MSRIDGRGQLTRYVPDALDRLQSVEYASGRRVTYAYDALSRQRQRQDAAGTTQLDWGQMFLSGVAYPQGQRLSYSYDAVGNLEQLQGPGGATTYAYDRGSRLSSMRDPSGQVAGFSNDFLDRVFHEWTVGGLASYRTFDAAGREKTLEQFPTPQVPTDRTGPRLTFYTATYDAAGQLRAVQEVDGNRVTYSYDPSGQMLSEARSGSLNYAVTYTYDGLGNRLSEVENGARTTYTYGAANRLLRIDASAAGYSPGGVTTFSYDRNGNLASEAVNGALTTYTWDEENRLARVNSPGGAVDQFVYFQDGRRYRSTHLWSDGTGARTSTQLFVWDDDNLLLEQDETLAARLHYLGRPEDAGEVLGQRQVGSGTEPTRAFFYGHDLSGNTRQVIGAGGTFVRGYLYNAFGEVLAESQGAGTVGPGGQVTGSGFQNERNPMRFGGEVGYYTDANDRLYVRARHYKPSIGRWISQDPIGFADLDWNIYGYVGNAPTHHRDASGLQWYAPDYTALTLSINPFPGLPILGVTVQFVQDRYGNLYMAAPGLNLGGSGPTRITNLPVSASLTVGWWNQPTIPDEEEMEGMITGPSWNANVAYLFGAGETLIQGNKSATEVGLFFPPVQAGSGVVKTRRLNWPRRPEIAAPARRFRRRRPDYNRLAREAAQLLPPIPRYREGDAALPGRRGHRNGVVLTRFIRQVTTTRTVRTVRRPRWVRGRRVIVTTTTTTVTRHIRAFRPGLYR